MDKLVLPRVVLVTLAVAWFAAGTAAAQVVPQSPGMFGNRVLGQSLAPRPSTFGGGVQRSASGNFLYIGKWNGSAFAAPMLPLYPGVAEQAASASLGAPPASQNTPAPPTPAPGAQQGSVTQALAAGPTSSQAAPTQEMAPPSTTAAPAWSFATLNSGRHEARRNERYTRSPELSERLTRIARSKGMLVSPALDVYTSGNVALLEGTVHNSAERTLLANILRLEPDVSQVNNRLAVATLNRYSQTTPPVSGR